MRKLIEENFACKSQSWIMTEHDERVIVYWKISSVKYIVEMIDDKRLEDEI